MAVKPEDVINGPAIEARGWERHLDHLLKLVRPFAADIDIEVRPNYWPSFEARRIVFEAYRKAGWHDVTISGNCVAFTPPKDKP